MGLILFYWLDVVVYETSLSFNTIKNTLQFRATDF